MTMFLALGIAGCMSFLVVMTVIAGCVGFLGVMTVIGIKEMMEEPEDKDDWKSKGF